MASSGIPSLVKTALSPDERRPPMNTSKRSPLRPAVLHNLDVLLEEPGAGVFITRLKSGTIACMSVDAGCVYSDTIEGAIATAVADDDDE